MSKQRSFYEILNIAPGAEGVVIEAAYKALMKKYHPDQSSAAATAKATEINQAFAVLKDPAKRAAYDKAEADRYAAFQLVRQAAPPPNARAVVSMWSGWFVALIFAGVTAFLMNQPATPVRSLADAPQQLASAEQDEEEAKPPSAEIREQQERAAFIEALALDDLKTTQAVLAQAPPVLVLAKPQQKTVAKRENRIALRSSQGARPAKRAAARPAPKRNTARPAVAQAQKEPDFLEQRGYVY